MNIRFEPIPDIGCKMTLQIWISNVECGGFIDYDGIGQLATDTEMSNIYISPSEFLKKEVVPPEWATHVIWFNR